MRPYDTIHLLTNLENRMKEIMVELRLHVMLSMWLPENRHSADMLGISISKRDEPFVQISLCRSE